MGKPEGNTGWRRLVNATLFSVKGLAAALRHEAAFRQELAVLVLAIPLAFWIGESSAESALLIAVWVTVLAIELLNSAVESVIDWVNDDHHELAGRAKDMGSAAVFLSVLSAGAIWLLLLLT